jgi:pimeloyl-ACP methyl ester carboxylesterase
MRVVRRSPVSANVRNLASPDVTLDTHVEDVVRHLELEGLDDVVLCGHSYGGIVVTAAADRASERVSRLAYIDALVPRDGESLFDLLPPEWTARLRASAKDGLVPLPMSFDDSAATHGSWYAERTVSQPRGTFEQAVRLDGRSEAVPRFYIRCSKSDAPVELCADRARAAGWWYRELDGGHDAQVEDPAALTDLLLGTL